MALFADYLSQIADIIGKPEESKKYLKDALLIKEKINKLMWDEKNKFYYDLTVTGELVPVKTIAGFWTLLAQVADKEKLTYLIAELNNKETFNRIHRVPTLAASEKGYQSGGYYWLGSVWAPTNTMIIRGLEKYGYDALAREIAMNHLNNVVEVYKKTGTIWENYSPDSTKQGSVAKNDFVGWSGIAPILYFIEYAIGIKANAIENKITWTISSDKKTGINKFWFGGKTINLVCHEKGKDNTRLLEVESTGAFTLEVIYNNKKNNFNIPANKKITEKI
jgi:glycogen debranching enzyme